MFDEQTPGGRKQVLIFGWTTIGIFVLICLALILTLSIRPLEQKPTEAQNTNAPAK